MNLINPHNYSNYNDFKQFKQIQMFRKTVISQKPYQHYLKLSNLYKCNSTNVMLDCKQLVLGGNSKRLSFSSKSKVRNQCTICNANIGKIIPLTTHAITYPSTSVSILRPDLYCIYIMCIHAFSI